MIVGLHIHLYTGYVVHRIPRMGVSETHIDNKTNSVSFMMLLRALWLELASAADKRIYSWREAW